MKTKTNVKLNDGFDKSRMWRAPSKADALRARLDLIECRVIVALLISMAITFPVLMALTVISFYKGL